MDEAGFIRLAGLVNFVLLAGVIYQFVATKIDEYRYPAPGEMVEVGGYSLHLACILIAQEKQGHRPS